MSRVRIRPSKSASLIGMFVGIAFCFVGLFAIIPTFGAFGILWTSVAGAIVVFHAVNLFSKRGMATTEIDVEGTVGEILPPQPPTSQLPFDERLRRLEQLRKDQLISELEYQQKRNELMRTSW